MNSEEIIDEIAELDIDDLIYIRSCIDKLIDLKTPEDYEDELL